MGRKPTVPSKFKRDQFEKLLEMQHTAEEIAEWFDFTERSLARQIKVTYGRKATFVELRKRFKAKGRGRLRAVLWTKALAGNASLIRLLAASELGIRERIEMREDPEQLAAKLRQEQAIADASNGVLAGVGTLVIEAQRVAALRALLTGKAKG